MTQYLGISFVVIVVTMCVGILSIIVTENIFKQIEAHKKRESTRVKFLCRELLFNARSIFREEIDTWLKDMKKKDEEKKKCADIIEGVCDNLDEEFMERYHIKVDD